VLTPDPPGLGLSTTFSSFGLTIMLTQLATALRSSLGPLCRTLGGNCGFVIRLLVVTPSGLLRGRRTRGRPLVLPLLLLPGFVFVLFNFSIDTL
jgi:hypothetical protein